MKPSGADPYAAWRAEPTTWGRIEAKMRREQLREARAYAAAQAPFRFPADQRTELRALLGRSAVVDALERVVTAYRRDPELDALALPRDLRKRLKAADAHLKHLRVALGNLPHDLEYIYREFPVADGLRYLGLELDRLLRWDRKSGQKTPSPRVRLMSKFREALRAHRIAIPLTRSDPDGDRWNHVESAYRIVYSAATRTARFPNGERLGVDLLRTLLRPLRIAATSRRD